MLDGVPGIKDQQCSRLKATVIICSSDAEATEQRQRLQSQNGMTYIPASHDPLVIAGQGTVGLELIRQWKGSNRTAVFCSVTNLDLIAGISVLLKRVAPEIKIIAVEVQDLNAKHSSLLSQTFAVAKAAACFHPVQGESFRLCRDHVDGVISVTVEELHDAMKDIYEGKLY
ncbi:hypothetical protein BP6252_13191 [Coleophoma cylindrospora]|uniref:Tryptophan synthase beta chain-like PALP domain-containing protein n=1 Tax=Coleophoma cylindrospora TaxID=1849047 RepID=A0A3D8QA50_9HELO|nr:hypothetical protein BP6252_13191 [Coleophoma cylindrospora]